LKVKITIKNNEVSIEGESVDKYEASIVLEAVEFGFPVETSLLLKDPEFILTKMVIKDFTNRKDSSVVKGRLIGTHGKTKNTIEKISDCKIIIKDNEVGVIGHAEDIGYATTAIANLIKGSKQSNVYNYLERINKEKKKK